MGTTTMGTTTVAERITTIGDASRAKPRRLGVLLLCPVVEVDENGRKIALHRQVVWN